MSGDTTRVLWNMAAIVASLLVTALFYIHGFVTAFLFWLAVMTILLALRPE